jgi:hypothetical protein
MSALSDIAPIAQNDPLNNLITKKCKVGEDELFRQAALIKVAIDIGGYDEVPIVLYCRRQLHRQILADAIARCPFFDGLLPSVVA